MAGEATALLAVSKSCLDLELPEASKAAHEAGAS